MATLIRSTLAVLVLLLAGAHDAAAKPGDRDARYGKKGVFETKRLDGGWTGLVQRDGRLLVAGGIFSPGILRLTPRGRLDRRFGNSGRARIAGLRDVLPFGLRRGRNDELQVAAATMTVDAPPVELLRFSRSGRALGRTPHRDFFAGPIDKAVQRPDGGAYVTNAYYGEVRAVRPDGAVDTAFGGGTISLGDPSTIVRSAIATRRDGRLVLAVVSGDRPELRQYTREGRPDPSWGGDGVVSLPFGATTVAVLRNGDVLAAGGGFRWLARAVRFRRDGTRRMSFGAGGVGGRITAATFGQVKDVVEDARGRLYLLTESKRIGVVALKAGGARLMRFGHRSRMVFPVPVPTVDGCPAADEASQILLDRRRGLLVVGTRYECGSAHPAFGCDVRDDFCASDVLLAVWRLKR
ncbi:MAG TPA: hypothetical protein VGW10_02620 [Solirubrobacteraceae bacterium]|nr:hypothetical protein [Solirubrobacteraceae bacterium]